MSEQETVNKIDELDIYGDQVKEVLSHPPSWLIRSGIPLVSGIVAVCIALTAFIKYPDIIISRGIFTSENPPIEIKVKSGGIIEKMHVKNGQIVQEDEVLMYIKNPTIPEDIKQLEDFFLKYDSIANKKELLRLNIPENLNLGPLQNDYTQLIFKFNEYKDFVRQTNSFDQIASLEEEIKNIEQLNSNLKKERLLLQDEVELVKKDYNRALTLETEGLISSQSKELAESKLLQYEQRFQNMDNNVIQNNIRIEQLQSRQLQLKDTRLNSAQTYKLAISEIIPRLKSKITNWQETFFLKAPIQGKINLNSDVVERKAISTDESIGFILSNTNNSQQYISTYASPTGIGKINLGDNAIIKLDSYPFREYGTVSSIVSYIAPIPKSDATGKPVYEIQLNLEKTILTNYNKEIPFKPNTTLTAEIITENRTILGRIFEHIMNLTKTKY